MKVQMNVRVEAVTAEKLRCEGGRNGVSYNLPLNLALQRWYALPIARRTKLIRKNKNQD